MKKIQKGNVKGLIYETTEEMAQAAADNMEKEIIELLKTQDEVNLMFSVGISQDVFHKIFFAKRSFDWNRVNLMLLDEKIGNTYDNPCSAPSRLLKYLKNAGTPYKNGYFFDGANPDPKAECKRFAEILNEHEPDLAFIGIGINGHVALCEPGEARFDDPDDCTIVKISDRTKLSNVESGDYKSMDDVPAYGLTITLPRLAKIKRKYTIMPYPEKADSAYEVFCGEIRESLPATYVRMHDWTIYMDKDAAARVIQELEK